MTLLFFEQNKFQQNYIILRRIYTQSVFGLETLRACTVKSELRRGTLFTCYAISHDNPK